MKTIFSKALLLALALTSTTAFAQGSSTSDQLNDLGTNRDTRERASRLESRTRVGIVQGRAVDRNWRFELGGAYGPVAFGDPYVFTQNLGANLNLHINPRFSLGVQYAHSFNDLTAEGQNRFDRARSSQAATGSAERPELAYPSDQVMGVINWYMTYGKINLFDWKTVQFDIYSLAGYGQVNVTEFSNAAKSQWTNTWTAGGGVGFWLTQHVTSRFELRYQNYQQKLEMSNRDLNLVIANFGLGVLL